MTDAIKMYALILIGTAIPICMLHIGVVNDWGLLIFLSLPLLIFVTIFYVLALLASTAALAVNLFYKIRN